MTKPTAAASEPVRAMQDNPKFVPFYKSLGCSLSEITSDISEMSDEAFALTIIGEQVLSYSENDLKAVIPVTVSEAKALLFMIYDLSNRAARAHEAYQAAYVAARSAQGIKEPAS